MGITMVRYPKLTNIIDNYLTIIYCSMRYPLVNIQKAIENGPVEIVSFPIKHGGSFQFATLNSQRSNWRSNNWRLWICLVPQQALQLPRGAPDLPRFMGRSMGFHRDLDAKRDIPWDLP